MVGTVCSWPSPLFSYLFLYSPFFLKKNFRTHRTPLCFYALKFLKNVGTIPTEIGLLSDLAIWGMERGGLTGSIPTQVGNLTNLIFIDLGK